MNNDEMEEYSKVVPEDEREINGEKGHKCHLPSMKINCGLEVTIGSKNKIINVCPGRVQYFTASAICCSDEKTIEIEYCGHNTKCICGEHVICGCLGLYKIVKSGIIFIPSHKLYKFHDEWFPTDILCFKVKDRDLIFDVVFTSSKCEDRRCKC